MSGYNVFHKIGITLFQSHLFNIFKTGMYLLFLNVVHMLPSVIENIMTAGVV